MEKTKRDLTPTEKKYAKIINDAPSIKEVKICIVDDLEKAYKKANRFKRWNYIVITRARDERGRFISSWALICCR